MRFLIYYIFVRILDIITTLLAVEKYSINSEVNPFIRYLLTYPKEEFIIINIILSLAVGYVFMHVHKTYKIVTYSYIIFMIVVILNNFHWIIQK